MKLATCSRCGVIVFYAKTPGGRMLPVNAEPDEGGNLIIRTDDDGATCVRPAFASDGDRPRYRCHYASCLASDLSFPAIKVLPDPKPASSPKPKPKEARRHALDHR